MIKLNRLRELLECTDDILRWRDSGLAAQVVEFRGRPTVEIQGEHYCCKALAKMLRRGQAANELLAAAGL